MGKKDRDEVVSGEIHLTIFFSHSLKEDTAILRINCDEGRNLASKDSNGLSDPYLILKLGKKEKKIKYLPETLNPKWNKAIEFNLKSESALQTAILEVTCMDHDTIGGDDFMVAPFKFRNPSHSLFSP